MGQIINWAHWFVFMIDLLIQLIAGEWRSQWPRHPSYILIHLILYHNTLQWFGVVLLYLASNAADIPCPLVWGMWLWLAREGRVMEFSITCKCLLIDILHHLEIKLDNLSNPQCTASRSHFLATHPFSPKYGLNQSAIEFRWSPDQPCT